MENPERRNLFIPQTVTNKEVNVVCVCKNSVVMNVTGEVAYTKGNIYISELPGCLTDNQGSVGHEVGPHSDWFNRHFVELAEVKEKEPVEKEVKEKEPVEKEVKEKEPVEKEVKPKSPKEYYTEYYTEQAIGDILKELDRAIEKWPNDPTDPVHAAAVLQEGAGELMQAALQSTYEEGTPKAVRDEAVRVGAMALRFLINFRHFRMRPSPMVGAITYNDFS
jgi:hypothetical protein